MITTMACDAYSVLLIVAKTDSGAKNNHCLVILTSGFSVPPTRTHTHTHTECTLNPDFLLQWGLLPDWQGSDGSHGG